VRVRVCRGLGNGRVCKNEMRVGMDVRDCEGVRCKKEKEGEREIKVEEEE
jgi:hypothetical protein